MPASPDTRSRTAVTGFLFGFRTAMLSVFSFVICVTYIGFGALTHDYGFSVGWSIASTVLMWAGPAQLVLVTGLASGGSLVETAVAVSLSSVRLLPMVVALMPLVKRDATRPWQLIVPVHFMAVSVWVEAMRVAPSIPREQRIAFCNGVGTTLLTIGVISTAAGYYLQSALPVLFGAAAMFITPISFLVSSARNATLLLDKAALALGLVIGPALALNKVEFDLLWTGIVGGTLAYGAHRWHRGRSGGSSS